MLRALITLAVIRRHLSSSGLAATVKRLTKSLPPSLDQADHDLVVARIARDVALAGTIFPGRARCLEQSLALYALLRKRSVAVKVYLGVRPYRFQAHAWVEYRGEPVNEPTEIVRKLVAIPLIVS